MALTDDLVYSFELDEASGDAIDAHGSNDMTVHGTGGIGTANGGRDFESGDLDYFDHADSAAFSGGDIDITHEVWVNHESFSSGDYVIFGKINSSAGHIEQILRARTGTDRYQYWVSDTGANQVTVDASNFGNVSTQAVGAWVQIIVEHDATNNLIAIRVNNGTRNTTSHSAGIFDGTAAFALGREGERGDYFDGQMKYFRRWNRLLTSDEITQLFNSGSGLPYASFGGGSPITVDVPVATITFSGVAPSCVKRAAVSPGACTLTGVAPATRKLAPVVPGTLACTGLAPTTQKTAAVSPGSLTLTGLAPTIAKAAPVPPGSFTLSGLAAAIRKIFQSAIGLVTFTGHAPTQPSETPASLTADIRVAPVLSGRVRVGPRLTGSIRVGPRLTGKLRIK